MSLTKQAFAGNMRRKSNGREDVVVNFLRGLLSDGASVAVVEIERRARDINLLGESKPISQDKRFRIARQLLGVVAYQRSRKWHWRVFAQMPPDAADGPSSTSATSPTSDARLTSGVSVTAAVPNRAFERRTSDDLARRPPVNSQMDPDLVSAGVLELVTALRRLHSSRSPPGMHPIHWHAFLQRAADFIASWGPRAAFLGWGATDLFAVDNANPRKCGLIAIVGAGRVIELDRQSATLEMPGGGRKIFVRRCAT